MGGGILLGDSVTVGRQGRGSDGGDGVMEGLSLTIPSGRALCGDGIHILLWVTFSPATLSRR